MKSGRLKGSIDTLRATRNKLSKEIGKLMGQKKFDEAETAKQTVSDQAAQLAALEAELTEAEPKLNSIMLVIPQMIDPSVPIGKDDRENVSARCSARLWCPILKFPTTPS